MLRAPRPAAQGSFRTLRPLRTLHKRPARPHVIVPGASLGPDWQHQLVDLSAWVGKGIILYVGFFCGLQYLHYRKLREDMEKHMKEEGDAKKNKRR